MFMRVNLAWIEYLEEKHNAKAVEVDGVFKVVSMICETCAYKNSDETKYCPTPSSVGCSKWKHEETK
ncbi:MAG: hypothetical protein KAV87_20960 [Desulfobacteraceae bacterium]|nr:hypothetical protein [Desulfobacteraceae bacterium]